MTKAFVKLLTALSLWLATPVQGADWRIQPGPSLWGARGGLEFGIYPASVSGRGDGGPRGLIRLGYPSLPHGRYALINFIAVEPIVNGRRGFSELERSQLDGAPGKRFWVDPAAIRVQAVHPRDSGSGARPPFATEQLEVTLRAEKFDNGAHVYLVATQRRDAPDEVAFTVHAEGDSAPMDCCILTATMGNMTRARELWLTNQVVSSLRLYPTYHRDQFAPHATFPRARLRTTPAGDVMVAITGDEAAPATVHPFPGADDWYYGGGRVTQYWRVPAGSVQNDLAAVVNGRFTYWQSRQPVPGGIAFENFEMRQRFRDGQQLIFGITRRPPSALGW
ncbi:MAG: hypothetical protein KGS61_07895 [Verrucomicrobia bacterium]|nr:hypothetical protein [Verrucomicrobiota bacterium]